MLGDALFEETAAVVDMIKLEAEVASNTLKITQPHEALAAEIIELAIQTADKDASLVEGAISFIQQDTEF